MATILSIAKLKGMKDHISSLPVPMISALFPDGDAGMMDARLRRWLTWWEFLALVLAFGFLGLFLWRYPETGHDYRIYIGAVHDDEGFYYAEWIKPVFWLLDKLPEQVGYALWSVVAILCLFFAARVFGGSAPLALLCLEFLGSMSFGQIDSFVMGALALGWWGMAHKKYSAAGFGFWLAATKFQIGLSFGVLFWLAAETDWPGRIRVLVLPCLLTMASLVLYPGWPFHLIERIQADPPIDWLSISLWRFIGPAALLFSLPPIILPLEKRHRFLALAAAATFAVPYFTLGGLVALFVLPVGWLPIMLGNLGILLAIFQFLGLPVFSFLSPFLSPLVIYLHCFSPLFPALRRAFCEDVSRAASG
jgi:hypothetical protein